MGSLFNALGTASQSLDVIQEAIGVVQNNVTNASTPGYVTQSLNISSRSFDPSGNLFGGVEASGVQDSRNVFAEQSVQSANQQSGYTSQLSANLNQLQQVFNVSGQGGIPSALSSLYSAFSSWSADPSNVTAQQSVITAAQGLSSSFAQTTSQVQQISSNTDTQLASSVSRLNQDTAQVAQLNGEIRTSSGNDAGLQAQLYNTLQDISGLANVTVNMQSDGTATLLLDGQSPLVQGTTQNQVTLGFTNAASPTAQLTMPDGTDVTALATQGSLGAGLNFRNTTIPAILSSGTPPGSLNQLMQGISDRVNTLLTGGQISAGPPAVSGVPLFVSSQNSLAVSPNITGSQLAAISPGPPAVANGVATELASMASPTNTADMINGASYTQVYGNITTSVGQQTAAAKSADSINTSVLNQAESLRAQVSGVSLNAQASKLLQFQESYQASAQMISTINTMMQSLLTVMQQVA